MFYDARVHCNQLFSKRQSNVQATRNYISQVNNSMTASLIVLFVYYVSRTLGTVILQ